MTVPLYSDDGSAKLPSRLFDEFLLYKKATTALLKWLAENSAMESTIKAANDHVKWTLESVKKAAAIVRAKNIDLPAHISWAFKDAISHRKDISAYFRSTTGYYDAKTQAHQAFTSVLSTIFQSLSESTPPECKPSHSQCATKTVQDLKHANLYDALEKLHIESKETEVPVVFGPQPPDTVRPRDAQKNEYDFALKDSFEDGSCHCYGCGRSFSFEDDLLSREMETIHTIYELESVAQCLKKLWRRVAIGEMSIVFAAWLTNIGFSHISETLFWAAESRPGDFHAFLCDRFKIFRAAMENTAVDDALFLLENHPDGVVFLSGRGLFNPVKPVKEFPRNRFDPKESSKTPPVILEKPTALVTIQRGLSDEPRQEKAERVCIEKMLQSLHVAGMSKDWTFVKDSSPVLHEFIDYFGSPYLSPPTELVFGLQMLVESYKSFIWTDVKTTIPTPMNCRVTALKFGNEVKTSLDRILTLRPPCPTSLCQCAECYQMRLQRMLHELKSDVVVFVSEKKFDLYHQNPWVCGSQMLELLSRVTYCGMQMCNRNQYVSSVLHMYNILRQVDVIPEETILLEHLCVVLGDATFQGPRPTRNFHGRYMNMMGARMEFDRDRLHQKKRSPSGKHKDCDHSSDLHGSRHPSWRMALPKFIVDDRIDERKLSIVAAIDSSIPRLDNGGAWAKVFDKKMAREKITEKEMQSLMEEVNSTSCSIILDRLERKAAPECSDAVEFPVAKINWLEVFLLCTEMLEIWASQPGAPPKPRIRGPEWKCVSGQQFVESFAEYADEKTRTKKGMRNFTSDAAKRISYVEAAMKKVLKGRKTSDFLWNV